MCPCIMETEATRHEDEKMRVLYEASYEGCVSILNTLIQQDPLIIHKISSRTTISTETPLHISALLGHLEFTKLLLARCPKLALELDSFRSTPLHFASAQGHIDIVKELLVACREACLVRDQERRIPLHYAVMRGRRDVVPELIRAKPESLTFHDDQEKNIFHLCVMHNHLEILKDLVALDTPDTNKLLIGGDSDCNNTILHLAIMMKQVEVVSYLISIPKIRSEALDLKNNMGYSAADIVHRIPKDSKSLEIQVILMDSGIKCGRREIIGVASEEDRCGKKKQKKWSWRYVSKIIDKWLLYNTDRLEDMRGSLCTVATVISTISFQAALNPPGSVIQQGIRPNGPDFNLASNFNTSLSQGPLGCMPYNKDVEFGSDGGSLEACPGKAMLAYRDPYDFEDFVNYNTFSFLSSLFVALMVVSGFPLKHRFLTWMISLGMSVSVMCLLNAYYVCLDLISPYAVNAAKSMFMINWICIGSNALVGMYVAVTYVIWTVKKLKAKLNIVKGLKEKLTNKHRKSSDQGTDNNYA